MTERSKESHALHEMAERLAGMSETLHATGHILADARNSGIRLAVDWHAALARKWEDRAASASAIAQAMQRGDDRDASIDQQRAAAAIAAQHRTYADAFAGMIDNTAQPATQPKSASDVDVGAPSSFNVAWSEWTKEIRERRGVDQPGKVHFHEGWIRAHAKMRRMEKVVAAVEKAAADPIWAAGKLMSAADVNTDDGRAFMAWLWDSGVEINDVGAVFVAFKAARNPPIPSHKEALDRIADLEMALLEAVRALRADANLFGAMSRGNAVNVGLASADAGCMADRAEAVFKGATQRPWAGHPADRDGPSQQWVDAAPKP